MKNNINVWIPTRKTPNLPSKSSCKSQRLRTFGRARVSSLSSSRSAEQIFYSSTATRRVLFERVARAFTSQHHLKQSKTFWFDFNYRFRAKKRYIKNAACTTYEMCARSENEISSSFSFSFFASFFGCRQRLQFYRYKMKADRVEPRPNIQKTLFFFFFHIFGLASFIKIKFLVINLYQFCSLSASHAPVFGFSFFHIFLVSFCNFIDTFRNTDAHWNHYQALMSAQSSFRAEYTGWRKVFQEINYQKNGYHSTRCTGVTSTHRTR